MAKGIGFNRSIHLSWLDATAAFCAETDDLLELRSRLESVVAEHLTGKDARRKTIDVLINIWLKNGEANAALRDQAVTWFQTSHEPGDRLWLHYGLTLLYYPFFRECTTVIGQLGRSTETVTNKVLIQRIIARLGHLGSLERSVQRVVSSLRDWNILTNSSQRHAYALQRQVFSASHLDLEIWLLICALKAHPVEEIHFADLLHLPALFPFSFTLTPNHLRQSSYFEVQRQGMGFDMVRLGS